MKQSFLNKKIPESGIVDIITTMKEQMEKKDLFEKNIDGYTFNEIKNVVESKDDQNNDTENNRQKFLKFLNTFLEIFESDRNTLRDEYDYMFFIGIEIDHCGAGKKLLNDIRNNYALIAKYTINSKNQSLIFFHDGIIYGIKEQTIEINYTYTAGHNKSAFIPLNSYYDSGGKNKKISINFEFGSEFDDKCKDTHIKTVIDVADMLRDMFDIEEKVEICYL